MEDDGCTPCSPRSPRFSKPLILSINTSLNCLGAFLSQIPEGGARARPIAFASKTLTGSQKRYPAHRLEFLALKWSVCKEFSHWLKGQSFTVWTNNNPFAYIMTKPKTHANSGRWPNYPHTHLTSSISPGQKTLWQMLWVETPSPSQWVKDWWVSVWGSFGWGWGNKGGLSTGRFSVLGSVSLDKWVRPSWKSGLLWCLVHLWSSHWLGNATECQAVQFLKVLPQMVPSRQDTLPVLSLEELRHSQESDSDIREVLLLVERGNLPSRRERNRLAPSQS